MPYLVQRVLRREFGPGTGIDRLFAFDYMGSSEFEWGALPAALREMREHTLVIRSIRHGEHTCTFIGHAGDEVKAQTFFADQLGERTASLKEATGLRRTYNGEKYADKTIGWWALDQDCPWLIFRNMADAYAWNEALHGKKT
jgi:hypothetical protein